MVKYNVMSNNNAKPINYSKLCRRLNNISRVSHFNFYLYILERERERSLSVSYIIEALYHLTNNGE